MLNQQQANILKYIANKPPISDQLPPSLNPATGYPLTPEQLNAPHPTSTTVGNRHQSLLQQRLHSTLMTVAAETKDYKGYITAEALIIEDPEILSKLDSSKLSPSLVMNLYGCHANMVAQRYSKILGIQTDTVEMVRGTAFHEIYENLLKFPPEERTIDNAQNLIKSTLLTGKYPQINQDEEQIRWLVNTVRNGFSFRRPGQPPETPQNTQLHQLPNGKSPLEVPLGGNIGGAKRRTFGIIDRITNHNGEGTIQDYKTASKLKQYYLTYTKRTGPNAGETIPRLPERITNREGLTSWQLPDGFREAFQQYSYLLLAEQNGWNVPRAELLFPAVNEPVNVVSVPSLLSATDNPTEAHKAFDGWVKDAYPQADQMIDTLTSTGTFHYSPSFLCSWCPLAKICPQFKPLSGKGEIAYQKQPDTVPTIHTTK